MLSVQCSTSHALFIRCSRPMSVRPTHAATRATREQFSPRREEDWLRTVRRPGARASVPSGSDRCTSSMDAERNTADSCRIDAQTLESCRDRQLHRSDVVAEVSPTVKATMRCLRRPLASSHRRLQSSHRPQLSVRGLLGSHRCAASNRCTTSMLRSQTHRHRSCMA